MAQYIALLKLNDCSVKKVEILGRFNQPGSVAGTR